MKEQTRNATLVGLSTEKEKGKTVYEGTLVETEEEVDMEAVPGSGESSAPEARGGRNHFEGRESDGRQYRQLRSNDQDEIRQGTEYAVTADGEPRKED